jgi:hypothetical protein
MKFDLSQQELSVLISSMQYMTTQQETNTGNPEIISRLYNKLFSRYEYLERIQSNYQHDL